MGYFADFLFRASYDKIAYIPVRDDFVSWYRTAYEDLELNDHLEEDDGELRGMAFDTRQEAIHYEPDTPLNHAINVVDDIENIVNTFSAYLTLSAIVFCGVCWGIGIYELVPSTVSMFSRSIGIASLVIPGSAYPIYRVLRHSIRSNGELIRAYNQKLVFEPGEIREYDRRRDMLAAIYMFHSSLCSTINQSVIVILSIIRLISPKTYGMISYYVKESLEEYYKDNFMRVLGRETVRIREARKARERSQRRK